MPKVLTHKGFKSFDFVKKEINFGTKIKINGKLTVTKDHRLMKDDLSFIKANDVIVGSYLFGGKEIADIEKVETVEFVYDLVNVADTHSYMTDGYESHNCIYLDEFAHVDGQNEFWESTYPVISSGDESKAIITSTPNGMEMFHKIFTEAEEGLNDFIPIKVEWWEHPKRDEKWKETTLKNMGSQEKFDQEYGNAFLGSSGTLISGNKLGVLTHKTPITESSGAKQFVKPMRDRTYFVICDVSRGKGLDYSAFSVIDCTELPYTQVATYRNNLVGPIDYANIIFQFATMYNEAYVLVELNDIGGQVSDVLYLDLGYENMVFTESAGRAGKRISGGFGKNVDRGIVTSRSVKALGCTTLKMLIEQDQLIISDHDTIEELSVFARKGSSYEATTGNHDDTVMPLVLFAWMTCQSYFKEITDIDTLSSLREMTEEQLEDQMLPFGFIQNTANEVATPNDGLASIYNGW